MRCTGRQTGWRISSGKEVRHFWARDFARCGVRGTCAVRRGNKKGRHLRFLPSLNTRFPWGVDGRPRKRRKGERQRIFSSAWYNTVSHFGCRTATQAVKLTQARHDSAAQVFTCADYLNPAVVANLHQKTVCAALSYSRVPSLALRAIHLVPRPA